MKSVPQRAEPWIKLTGAILLIVLAWMTWDVIRDERIRGLAFNSLTMVIGSLALAVPAGTVLAILVTRTNMPGRWWVIGPLGALLVIPLYLQAATWEAGFGQMGWYTLSAENPQPPLLRGLSAVVWIHGLAGIPWVTFIVAAALSFSNAQLEEEALLDASALRVLSRITLRRAAVAIAVSALWVAVRCASEISVTDLYRYRSYSEEFYLELSLSPTVSLASAWRLVVPPMALILTVTIFMMRLANPLVPATLSDLGGSPRRFDLGRWKWPLAGLALLFMVLMVALPLGSLVYKCGQVVNEVDGQRVRTWSLSEFVRGVSETPGRFGRQFRTTFVLGTATSSLALAVAIPLAWWAVGWGRRIVAIAVALGLAVPGPLVGLAVLRAFRNHTGDWGHWIDSNTVATPMLASTLRILPLIVLCSWAVLRTIPSEQLDAAATEGAGRMRRLWLIAVPQRVMMWLVIWLVGAAWASGELSASIVATPPQLNTIPILVFGYIHMGVRNVVACICLTMIVGFSLLAIAVVGLVKASSTRTRPTFSGLDARHRPARGERLN